MCSAFLSHMLALRGCPLFPEPTSDFKFWCRWWQRCCLLSAPLVNLCALPSRILLWSLPVETGAQTGVSLQRIPATHFAENTPCQPSPYKGTPMPHRVVSGGHCKGWGCLSGLRASQLGRGRVLLLGTPDSGHMACLV